MKLSSASAPGKIILAGEYAVVFGYPGLAVPASIGIDVHLEEAPSVRTLTLQWPQASHQAWKDYVLEAVRLIEKHRGPVHGTLAIGGKLPLGKGMGSSTALTIALSRCLLGNDCERIARSIEDKMNPGHSGMDFAVIWHGKPVRYVKNERPTVFDQSFPFLKRALLIDTGIPRESTPDLVAWVKKRETDLALSLQMIGTCADRLMRGEDPLLVMKDHHREQIALGVVPKKAQTFISSIERAGGAAKVVGAGARTGGGGIVLTIGINKKEVPAGFPIFTL